MNSEKVFRAKRCVHSHDEARFWQRVRMKPLRFVAVILLAASSARKTGDLKESQELRE
jgi:hypothetical protein